MTTIEQLERLTNVHAARRRTVIGKLVGMLWNTWRPFDGWYDDDRVAGVAARSADLVDAAAQEAFMAARAFVLETARASGRPLPPRLPDVRSVEYPRTNITPLEVYSRPAETFRYLRSIDTPAQTARDSARSRLESMADLDIQAVTRNGYRDAFRAVGVTRYRRIIHPELSVGGGTCGLCIAASTQILTIEDPLPLHGGCQCTVAELDPRGRADIAARLNGKDLERLYGDAGSTAREDLVRTRYQITEHGELGPVLERDGTTESEAHRAARLAKMRPLATGPEQWAAEIETLERTTRRLELRGRAGEDVATPLEWQRDRLANLRGKLAAAA